MKTEKTAHKEMNEDVSTMQKGHLLSDSLPHMCQRLRGVVLSTPSYESTRTSSNPLLGTHTTALPAVHLSFGLVDGWVSPCGNFGKLW